VTLTTHPFWCRGQGRVELFHYCPYWPYGLYWASVPVQGCNLPFPIETLKGKIQNKIVAVGKNMMRDKAEIAHRPDIYLITKGVHIMYMW